MAATAWASVAGTPAATHSATSGNAAAAGSSRWRSMATAGVSRLISGCMPSARRRGCRNQVVERMLRPRR